MMFLVLFSVPYPIILNILFAFLIATKHKADVFMELFIITSKFCSCMLMVILETVIRHMKLGVFHLFFPLELTLWLSALNVICVLLSNHSVSWAPPEIVKDCPFQLCWINEHQQTLLPQFCFQIILNLLNATSFTEDPWRLLAVTSFHGISWLLASDVMLLNFLRSPWWMTLLKVLEMQRQHLSAIHHLPHTCCWLLRTQRGLQRRTCFCKTVLTLSRSTFLFPCSIDLPPSSLIPAVWLGKFFGIFSLWRQGNTELEGSVLVWEAQCFG